MAHATISATLQPEPPLHLIVVSSLLRMRGTTFNLGNSRPSNSRAHDFPFQMQDKLARKRLPVLKSKGILLTW